MQHTPGFVFYGSAIMDEKEITTGLTEEIKKQQEASLPSRFWRFKVDVPVFCDFYLSRRQLCILTITASHKYVALKTLAR